MTSEASRVLNILRKSPSKTFSKKDLRRSYEEIYGERISKHNIDNIVQRTLKNRVLRTPGQLADGHHYSYSDMNLIADVYERHLFPYNAAEKEELLRLIAAKPSHKLAERRTSLEHADSLAKLLGFCIGDGHLKEGTNFVSFFFYLKKDAECCAKELETVFGVGITPRYKSQCYRLAFSDRNVHRTLKNIGAPAGNKVFRPFLVPRWVYEGEREIKRAFLRGIFGAEGSKPFKGRWRIQFVISKNDLYLLNLATFLNQLRSMLAYFGIPTTHLQIRHQPGREFHGRFYITGEENVRRFHEEIGFAYASEKQEALEKLIYLKKA